MSNESGTTRWWEYYLPRYLMPSVAGVAIVNWLCSYGAMGSAHFSRYRSEEGHWMPVPSHYCFCMEISSAM